MALVAAGLSSPQSGEASLSEASAAHAALEGGKSSGAIILHTKTRDPDLVPPASLPLRASRLAPIVGCQCFRWAIACLQAM